MSVVMFASLIQQINVICLPYLYRVASMALGLWYDEYKNSEVMVRNNSEEQAGI